MAEPAIRQAPGWWPALVRAECGQCGWTGPVRDLSNLSRDENVLVKLDAAQHECGGRGMTGADSETWTCRGSARMP